MRTTLNLDDQLMRELKRRAAESGRTMTEMVEAAIRELLAREAADRVQGEFQLLTIRGRRRPVVDVADRDALLRVMEDGP